MNVELISCSKDCLSILYTAAKTCYSADDPLSIMDSSFNSVKQEDQIKILKKVFSSGHLSVAEHVNFTFAISGISRACSHQLVRHRHASYSQKSQRYVKEGEFEYVIPPSIENFKADIPEDIKWCYISLMEEIQDTYDKLIANGIPAEDARMVLPNACETSLTVTMNLRELIQVCNLRLCNQAQWEIRAMVQAMKNEVLKKVKDIFPLTKELLVPNCKHCTDFRPCVNRK